MKHFIIKFAKSIIQSKTMLLSLIALLCFFSTTTYAFPTILDVRNIPFTKESFQAANCEGAANSALRASCVGINLTGIGNLLISQTGNISSMGATEACKKAKSLNKTMAAVNGGLVGACIKATTKCISVCNAAASVLGSNPATAAQAARYTEIASKCGGERQRIIAQGGLQIAQNMLALQGKCEGDTSTTNGDPTNELGYCDTLPPALRERCLQGDVDTDMCQLSPELQQLPICMCQVASNADHPSCQGFQLPDIEPPPPYVGYCEQNPEMEICQRDQLTIPPRNTADNDLDFNDPHIDYGGFDPSQLGSGNPDDLTPEYTGNRSFGGGSRSAGGGGAGGLAGGGGGGFLGGGGGGAIGPLANDEEPPAEDGIYDTDVLGGVDGGIASTGQGYSGGTTGTGFGGKKQGFGKLKPFNLKKYLPKNKLAKKRTPAGAFATNNQITPANGLSNFQKISRMMSIKRSLLMTGMKE